MFIVEKSFHFFAKLNGKTVWDIWKVKRDALWDFPTTPVRFMLYQHFHLPLAAWRDSAHAVDSCLRVRALCTRVRTCGHPSMRADVGRDEPLVRAREDRRRKEPPVKERRERVLLEVVVTWRWRKKLALLGATRESARHGRERNREPA